MSALINLLIYGCPVIGTIMFVIYFFTGIPFFQMGILVAIIPIILMTIAILKHQDGDK